jgi:hypothetical protein
MNSKAQKHKNKPKQRVFLESPYDIEIIFESLSIASSKEKELLYIDRLISTLRLDPLGDLTNINYNILKDLNLIDYETNH